MKTKTGFSVATGCLFLALLGSLSAQAKTAAAPSTPATAERAQVSAGLTPGGDGKLTIVATGVQPVAPLFFTATAEQKISLGMTEVTDEMKLVVRIVQGRPEVLTLGLTGDGDVVAVTGAGLRDWSVRQGVGPAAAKRFLDLRPTLIEGAEAPRTMELVVRTRKPKPTVPGQVALLVLTAGEATALESRVRVQPDATLEARLAVAEGVTAVGAWGAPSAPMDFITQGAARIELTLSRRGALAVEAELTETSLSGTVNAAGDSVNFQLRAQARVQKAGARLTVLTGGAALLGEGIGEGWHVELVKAGERTAYELVFERAGNFPVTLPFTVAVREAGDWRRLEFRMPAGAVVPLQLSGLSAGGVEFDTASAVVPAGSVNGWQGFLPANGIAALGWKTTQETGVETLSFTSTEQTEVRVGAGLLRQSSQLAFRLLQGKLHGVRLRIEGPGEIIGVDGAHVLGWKVVPTAGSNTGPADARVLDVKLSRPFEGDGTLTVRSQAALGGFPVRAEAMRITPEGGVRHAGFIRVANTGAVRLEVADVEGMMQLAPEQFPGGPVEAGARQIFVYRFPAAERAYRVLASQILPEVGVSQVVTYELAETDRVINADLELEVREAPLRDWSLLIPADYAVVAVTGAGVADYAVESEAREARRTLKVTFTEPVTGRHLLRLRLEKNQAAGAGAWTLPALGFPGAKSVRGQVGAVAAPGYRLVPGAVNALVEVPLSYFSRQVVGLQQAWRLRDAEWAAAVTVEALGQSVQADVFHLYSLREGVVYGSVLVNYFVIGAPANEWRLEVPASVGNIDITGQGVRRDWRREGNQVIVSLHQPVLGAATMLVTFEQPMSARGGVIHPGEVRPLGVQSERGYVQVVSPLQVKQEVRKAEGGLLKLEPLELPAELRLLTTAPSLAVYHYTARPFALELGVEWYQPGETVEQLVDFAQLSSRISRDGQVVTEARFFVKTRGRKALRMELPAGAKLWEARVDGEVVNARTDAGQVLVPLIARLNPNEPVDVLLRLGQPTAGGGSQVRVVAPKLAAPMVIGEWTLHADEGRLLVPQDGNVALPRSPLTENGFEWLDTRGREAVISLLVLIGLAVAALRARSVRWLPLGVLAAGIAVLFASTLALQAASSRRINQTQVNYAAMVVPADTTLTVAVDNLPTWRALTSIVGAAAVLAGVALLVVVGRRGRRAGFTFYWAGAVVLIAAGVLAQRGGVIGFFILIALALGAFGVLPGLGRGWRSWRDRKSAGATTGVAGVAPLAVLLLASAWLATGSTEARAEVRADKIAVGNLGLIEGTKAAQSWVQRWEIRGGRLFAEAELTMLGEPGDTLVILKAPAVLTNFTGDGLRLAKVERPEGIVYVVTPDRANSKAARSNQLTALSNRFTARLTYELPVADINQGLPILTGPAAAQQVTVQLDQGGWQFSSPMAVQEVATSGMAEGRSGAKLVLGPDGEPVIRCAPQTRNLAAEPTRFYAEGSTLFIPGPGVVNGYARVTVRPVQGRVSALELDVPAGFTVGEVGQGPVGTWRFDPASGRLRVAVEPAQAAAFNFRIEFQRGTAALPYELAVRPVRVLGTAGEVGMVALGFGGDAQPEAVKAEGLSLVSGGDFDATLIPRGRDKQPLAGLQNVYRYGAAGGALALRVAPVEPEVRVVTRQVFSIGSDRLVLATDLTVSITRVGLFKLSFALPEGLEVESLTGPALSHWTEATEGGRRIVTLHLNGRTIGEQAFAITLAGPAPAAQASWPVPRVTLREATRQTGELQLVPEKGLRLQAMARVNASPLDPRSVGNTRPGALAFRLLQADWSLAVGIEALEPWVTVQALQEVTAREGQTLTRIALRYKVENAAVKILRLRLPGMGAEQIRTVRATGPAVSDFVALPGAPGRWEIRFQRGIVGETDVQIEFQGATAQVQGKDPVATPVFEAVRQVNLFVAVRAGGRLELEAAETPRGWQRIDWAAVPAQLQDRGDRSVPVLVFRVAEPEAPLAVAARRHEVADALKLRVTGGELTTVFSPMGPFLTAVQLRVEVLEKSTLRIRLPEGAQLFNTFVNRESVAVVREGDEYLFYVTPNSSADRTAAVRLVYAVTTTTDGRIALRGPGVNVPLENVSWRVVLPAGYELADYTGGLRLREERHEGSFGLGDYQSLVVSKRVAEAKQATDFIAEANVLIQQGQQQQAGEALSRAAKANVLDQATNEDARVQLRALKTQQAVLGLNTRRQKLYLDNKGTEVVRNAQLEQAANLNPFLQGQLNYDPKQADQLLLGNTADENSALRGIAGRIVDQQLANEAAPAALDVTLAEKGRVLTFTRSLQVDGGAPLILGLEVRPAQQRGIGFGVAVLAGVALLAAGFRHRRTQ